MPISTIAAGTARRADLNTNFSACLTKDTAQTVTVTHTWSVTQTFSAGISVTGGGVQFPSSQSASADPNNLDDYEEGTWTPTDVSGAALSFSSVSGTYEKIGRMVIARFTLTYPATADGTASAIGSLPFTVANNSSARQGFVSYTDESTLARIVPNANATTFNPVTTAGAAITNATLSGNFIYGTLMYYV